MKYYATKMGTDPEGNPIVLKQIEIGLPRINYYEMRNVCDTTGNTYYSYGSKIGKIPVDAEDINDKVEIDVNTALGLTTYEVLGIALNREQDTLYLMINTLISDTNMRIYTLPVNFTNISVPTIYKDLSAETYGYYFGNISVDRENNIWMGNEFVGNSGSHYIFKVRDDKTLYKTLSNGYCPHITLDARGICWVHANSQLSSDWNPYFYYINNEVQSANIPALAFDNIVDSVSVYIDDKYYLYLLRNYIVDNVQACILRKIDVTDYNVPVQVGSNLSLVYNTVNLTQCFNLHANTNGDIFFSTYSPADGYNTYKVTMNIDGTMNNPVIHYAGLGSKTTGNDPYGYFLSQYGHTGANIN